jgi:hypothetical protein
VTLFVTVPGRSRLILSAAVDAEQARRNPGSGRLAKGPGMRTDDESTVGGA